MTLDQFKSLAERSVQVRCRVDGRIARIVWLAALAENHDARVLVKFIGPYADKWTWLAECEPVLRAATFAPRVV